ncbi:hypothetical protein FEM48_Zijuj04G0093200 [Ziziphus jujuba var. spinosa]|uniref:Uncharacterized protein n=1 Tax=Ziziphus jujuba var. spinosa TaxID=714518 RepID=A0A978VJ19_ZIZJJ|nr:hypothetical protein FEM48_Zijuj04G0093200 [Ziziphus jujuba var. spinosa]
MEVHGLYHRCGGWGEVCILWNQLQTHKLSHQTDWTVHRHSGGERECVGRNGVVAAFVRSFCCRFFSRALPHHCGDFYSLCSGLSMHTFYNLDRQDYNKPASS